MRRILQASGAEVIHLGHNRSVKDVVDTALPGRCPGHRQSAATRAAMSNISSTWWSCCVKLGLAMFKSFGGGGGVIVPSEIAELEAYGVARIYSPEDGRIMGLQGMINDMLEHSDFDPRKPERCHSPGTQDH